jgi:hypothetical protein
MHRHLRRCLGAAALCLLAPSVAAKALRDAEADLAVMKTLPVYVIAPATPLRPTVPVLMNNETASMRGVSTYGGLISISSGTPLIMMFAFKKVQERSLDLAVPGMRTLRDAGCLVDDSGANMLAINAILSASGFANAPATRVESDLEIPKDTPRIVMFAISSITPDYAAIITSYGVEVYAPQMPKAPSRWKVRPSVSYNFAIVSDSIGSPSLSSEATEATEAPPMPVEAELKDGDGSSGTWPLAITAAQRAKTWALDQCARVNAALDSNRSEGSRLLSLSLAGQKPSGLPDDWNAPVFGKLHRELPTRPDEATQRRLYADGQWLTVSRRAGDNVMVDFRFAWLPEDAEALYDKLHSTATP